MGWLERLEKICTATYIESLSSIELSLSVTQHPSLWRTYHPRQVVHW